MDGRIVAMVVMITATIASASSRRSEATAVAPTHELPQLSLKDALDLVAYGST